MLALAVVVLRAAPAEGRREALALLAEGQEALRNGRVKQAIDLLRRSAEVAPSPAAYYNLGQALRKAGQTEEARQAFEEALRLNPDFELARQALGKSAGGHAAESGNLDFDAALNERETLDSLRRPDQEEPRNAKPLILSLGALLPKVPKTAAGSASPKVPSPTGTPMTGTARDTLIPAAPVEIVNEVPTREIASAAPSPAAQRGAVAAVDQAGEDAATKKKGSPISLWRGKKHASHNDATPGVEKNPKPGPSDFAPGRKERKTSSSADVANIDAAAVNQAAFGEDTEAAKPSKRYNNPGKILLGSFEFHREKAEAYRRAQRWVEAADEYQKALEKNPDDAETRADLAECLARAGEVDVAETQFQQALQMDPNDPKVLFRMGNTYRELKKLDQAISAYRRALNADPRNATIRNNLGVVYMEKGEYAKAAAEFKKVLDIDPNYTNAILNLGILYDERLGDRDQALRYYQMYVQKQGPRAKEVQRWIDDLQK
jgi:tetratricopeptide (TPR) repeat protein